MCCQRPSNICFGKGGTNREVVVKVELRTSVVVTVTGTEFPFMSARRPGAPSGNTTVSSSYKMWLS